MKRLSLLLGLSLAIVACDSDDSDISTVNAKANDDAIAATVGQTVTFNVLDNDLPNPGAFFTSAGSPDNPSLGTLTNNGNGSFTFAATTAGELRFNYTMFCNTANGPSQDQAEVIVTVGL